MKTVAVIIGLAFLIITAVMINLVRSGGALKPAGVIKPAEIGNDPTKIGKQIGVRLFPDFNATKFVIWRVQDDSLASIPRTTIEFYHGPVKPTLHDLRAGGKAECTENCWYILDMNSPAPELTEPAVEIFIEYFIREEKVPETCENEKILEVECVRPVAVREVHRKLKTSAPHYFMQRYKKSQFYLYLEKAS